MEGWWGSLENCNVFPDLIVFNNRSIAHFCAWWGYGVKKLFIFCERHEWMIPFDDFRGNRISLTH